MYNKYMRELKKKFSDQYELNSNNVQSNNVETRNESRILYKCNNFFKQQLFGICCLCLLCAQLLIRNRSFTGDR